MLRIFSIIVNRYSFMRGIAAIMILIVHTAQTFSNLPWVNQFKPVFELGKYGVAIFFVLSAYLLTKNLDKAKVSSKNLMHFYLRRIYRILPAYYFCLFALIFLKKPDSWQIASHFLLLFGLSNRTFGGINYPGLCL